MATVVRSLPRRSLSKTLVALICLAQVSSACRGNGRIERTGSSACERPSAGGATHFGGAASSVAGDAGNEALSSSAGAEHASAGSSNAGGSSGQGGSPAASESAVMDSSGAAGGIAGGASGPGGTACAGITSGVEATKTYHVSPAGSPGNDGTSSDSPMDFSTALDRVAPGEMILLLPGTYAIPYTEGTANTITLSQSGESGSPISIVAADCGRAVFDFSFPERAWVQNSFGFHLTGSYWYVKGIDVTRAGYQGVYVRGQYNTFEDCAFYDNRNTGFEVNKGGAHTTVINCDAYRNYDPKKAGGMADGFAPKQTQGPGNRFIGCRAWENSDDGFDAYASPETVTFDRCWAFRNGIDIWNYGNYVGNGNGFKLGGNRG